MHSNTLISRAIRLLKGHYRGNLAFLVLLLVLIVFDAFPFLGEGTPVSVTLERYAIMIPIIAIPLALRHFARQVKKTKRPMEPAAAVQLYKRASFTRLYITSGVALMQIVLYGYSRNMNFFWLAIVLFTVFLFCRPSEEELTEMTEVPDE